MSHVGVSTGMGLTQWQKVTVERIPIPLIPADKQRPFIKLVDSILEAKSNDPDLDTSKQEAKIDVLVYALYGLTAEQVAAVEGR